MQQRFLAAFIAVILSFSYLTNIYAESKQPGDKVEDFTVKGIDGNNYTLSDILKKSPKGAVVMFWSTECPYVQPYTSRINDIAGSFSSQGYTFIGVNSNVTEDMNTVKEHASEKKYNFMMTKDENSKTADMFGATRTPEIFVISPDMIVLYHGRIDNDRDEQKVTSNDLKNALDEIAAGKEVSVKSTKSFGCSIKRPE